MPLEFTVARTEDRIAYRFEGKRLRRGDRAQCIA
jgi:hypothetical protein